MSLFTFESSGPAPKGGNKSLKLALGVGALAGVITLGSTLAANINLNGGGNVEFGQGVATTTACDDDGITVTPFSTFVNAQGAGSHKLSSIRLSGIDSREDNCEGKTFRIRAYGDGSDPLDLFQWEEPGAYLGEGEYEWNITGSYDFVDITRTATDFLWTSGGTDDDDVIDIDESDIEQTAFTLNLVSGPSPRRTPLALAEDVKRITVETFTATDTVVTYAVGDIGPGGGKIFYVAESPFICGPTRMESCTYLEVAPDGWNTGEDPVRTWAPEGIGRASQITPEAGIGFGYSNSLVIDSLAGANTTNCAASLALAYTSVSGSVTQSDWFLPSRDELNELYLRHNEVGSFGTSWYFTSSDYSVDNGGFAWGQRFTDGFTPFVGKQGENSFRPIRAF
jgi:hypothetical protein